MIVLALCVPVVSTAQDNSLIYVPSNQLGEYWHVRKSAKPKYPRGPDNKIKEACVVVAFIIESNGRTSAERAIAAYPSERFAESALNAIRKFRFEPAEANQKRKPVYTTTLFTFQLSRSNETNEQVQDALTSICASAAQTVLDRETSVGQ